MWDLNFRGLGLALQLLLLLLLAPLCQPSVGKTTATSTTDDLPHPWLTADRTAKVLELVCRPPATIKWDKMYGLKLRFSRLARDVTLASVTTATEFQIDKVPDIPRVSFNGNWNSPSLSVLMPFTSEDFGEYSCSGQYEVQGSTGGTEFPYFNTNITVSGSRSQPPNKQNFEVHVIDAHEVRVTWRSPKGSKFIQASVSRTSVVKETGKELSASESLFTTSVEGSFVYNSKVTLLAKFQYPSQDGGNFSMRLYVDSALCHPYCRYSCHVPYTGCYGQKVKFCGFSQGGVSHNQGSVPESIQSTDLESTTECQDQDTVPETTDFKGAFIGVLIPFILVLTIVSVVSVLCYLFKTGKFQTCTCLNKSVASPADNVQPAKQNSPDGDNREVLTSGRGTHPQKRPNYDDASEQNPPPARSTQNDEPQSSTPPSEGIGPSQAEEKAKTRSKGPTSVTLPPLAAASGDNNPTLNNNELDAKMGESFTLPDLHRSEDRHETKDNSPSNDRSLTKPTVVVTDIQRNPVQSNDDTEHDKEVETPESRQLKDAARPRHSLRLSATVEETQTLLPSS